MSEKLTVSFCCFIPDISSALKLGGDAARVLLEVPASDVESAVALIALKNTPLRVTIEVEGELSNDEEREKEVEDDGRTQPVKRSSAKQRVG